MNIADIIIASIVAIALLLALRASLRRRKNCDCGCGGCGNTDCALHDKNRQQTT